MLKCRKIGQLRRWQKSQVFVFGRFGEEHFAIFVGPKSVEVGEDVHHRLTLARIEQVLEGDFEGMRRFDHVENLVFHILEHDRFLKELFLN